RVRYAHVHDALEPKQRTGRRRSDTVLACAGLGDHAPLAHALGQQRLPEGVVELVRASVVEVLALEVHRPAELLGHAPGAIQRRRAAGEVAQQARELLAEGRVLARLRPGLLELRQRGHERLGHILPAVWTEAMLDGAHAGWATPEGARAARKKARSLASSLRPGAASVPLAVSTA